MLSFDSRTGRYAVALDDGKELSLEAECVAAGCVGGGEQRVLAMPGRAVLLARVPAGRLEGSQTGVRGGCASLKLVWRAEL